MAMSKETLKAMIRDYQGLEMSDAELDLVLPEIENYLAAAKQMRELDLSNIMSGRITSVKEGGEANG